MKTSPISPLAPTPIDSEKWKWELQLLLFVTMDYKLKEFQGRDASCRRAPIIGAGQGIARLVVPGNGYKPLVLPPTATAIPELSKFTEPNDLALLGAGLPGYRL